MVRPVAVGVLVLVPLALAAADDDPIKAELDRARAAHAGKVAAAKSALAAAFDAKLKEVAGKGDLDGAKAVKAQAEQFEKDGKLPAATQLARDKRDYEAAVKAADDQLRKALEKAKTEYTKKLKLAEAEAVAAELSAPAGKPPAKAAGAKKDDGRTRFVCTNGVLLAQTPGTKKWKEFAADGKTIAEFEEASRNPEYVELIDRSRDGLLFRLYATHTYIHSPQLRMPPGWWHEHHIGKWSK
jgi:hypothetical protein